MKKQSGLAALALLGLAGGLMTGCGGGGGAQAPTQRYAAYVLGHQNGWPNVIATGIANGRCVGIATGSMNDPGTNILPTIGMLWEGTSSYGAGFSSQTTFYGGITSTDGTIFAGWGLKNGTRLHRALVLFPGQQNLDITPSGYFGADILGIAGTQQVGSGQLTEQAQPHAILWTGTAESAIDLNPSAFTGSVAYSTDGATQVGSATNAANQTHAALWSGTAATFVDLNPANAAASSAFAISGGQIVGKIDNHAFLWSGATGPKVDLHPSGFDSTVAKGANSTAGKQVGYGVKTSSGPGATITHALVWSGTASSSVDLEQFLPAGYSESTAAGIDSFGNIIGSAKFAGVSNAILWVPISNQVQ